MENRMCIKVEEMAKQLAISRAVAYQLSRQTGFPSVKIGRRILIPVDGLNDWLQRQSGNQDDHTTAQRKGR